MSTTSSLAVLPAGTVAPVDPRRVALAEDPFEPQTMPQLFDFAERVAGTPFAPKDFQGKPNDCFIAMVYGRSVGLGALQSLQGIAVINGKPALYGETFWAVVISHPHFEDCEEDVTDERAQVILTRKGRKPHTATFSMADAQIAGLKGKTGPWTNYPKGQMLWRARHRAATALFADALKGILPTEVATAYEGLTIDAPRPMPNLPEAASAPAPATTGSQPAPAAKVDPLDEKISAEQSKQWNDALKAANFKPADKRAELDRLGVGRSGEMTVRQFNDSLAKCKDGPPPIPAPAGSASPEKLASEQPSSASGATEAAASSASAPSTEPEQSDAEKLARRYMTGLNLGIFEQDTLIKRHTKDGETDWVKIALSLDADAQRAGLND